MVGLIFLRVSRVVCLVEEKDMVKFCGGDCY